jgi:predicted permease
MWNLLHDLRFAMRVLRGSPGYSAVAVATLALGIAANATVFGWIDTVILNPVPGVRDGHQLVALQGRTAAGAVESVFTHPDFRDYQRSMRLASGVVASHLTFFNVGPTGQPVRVIGQVASANFFSVLGVQPYLGRVFRVDEDQDRKGAHPIVVVSHRLWRTYLRSDPAAIGRTLRINGRDFSIVGVLPPAFRGTIGGAAMDLWVPLSMIVEVGALNTWAASDRNARFLDLIVRREPGVSVEQASADAASVAASIAAAHPKTHTGWSAAAVPLSETTYGLQATLGKPLRILMVVCVLVLLIACANVTNLLMARSLARRREYGIRIATGATSPRLMGQLLAEVSIVAFAGAVAGVLLAQWLAESLILVLPPLDPPILLAVEPLLRPGLSVPVLLFTAAVTILCAVAATLAPALFAARVDVIEALKDAGRGTAGTRSHAVRNGLVVAEVALSVMALVGAGLAIVSFREQAALSTGFDSRNVLAAHLHLSTNGYSLEQEKAFCHELRRRLEAEPGVEAVSFTDSIPLSMYSPPHERILVEGAETRDGGVVTYPRVIATPGYFDLMRIPLVAGRDFEEHDAAGKPLVAIVNQTFARRYFGTDSAIGRRVRVSGNPTVIIGVARDAKYHHPGEDPGPLFYSPFRQRFFSGHQNFVVIRSRAGTDAALAALRRNVVSLNASPRMYDALPLADFAEAGLFAERVAAGLLSALGLLSLALSAAGLYSVMSYGVAERTQEFGIRIALGAKRWQVIAATLQRGMALTAAGLATGMVGSIFGFRAISRAFDAPLYGSVPAVFAAAGLFLASVALLACYLPAYRAVRTDPMTALRAD